MEIGEQVFEGDEWVPDRVRSETPFMQLHELWLCFFGICELLVGFWNLLNQRYIWPVVEPMRELREFVSVPQRFN